jgi:hypothetical protein
MDEHTGILNDTLIDALGQGLRRAIAANTPPTDR